MTNYQTKMTNQLQNQNVKKYDLEERTAKFGEEIVKFAQKIPSNEVNKPITSQLVRAGTSVGANYCEADSANSKKDFVYKIALCKKESKETKHWLRIASVAVPNLKDEAVVLWREGNELNLIFSSIIKRK